MGKRKKKTTSKYGVKMDEKGKAERTKNGVLYDSLMEKQFLEEFIEPQIESGIIQSWERQKTWIIFDAYIDKNGKKVQAIKYKSDFEVVYSDGRKIIYDVKGRADSVSKLKKKLFEFKYPEETLIFITRNKKHGDEYGWIDYFELQNLLSKEKKLKKVLEALESDGN